MSPFRMLTRTSRRRLTEGGSAVTNPEDARVRRRFGKTGFGFGSDCAGRDLVSARGWGRTEPPCEPPGAMCALSDATRRVAALDMTRAVPGRVKRGDL